MLLLWAVASGIRIDPKDQEGMEKAFARIEEFQRDSEHRIWNGTQMTYEFDRKTNEWALIEHDIIEDDQLQRFQEENGYDLNYRHKRINEKAGLFAAM